MSSQASASDPGEGSSTGSNSTQAITLSEELPIEMVELAAATPDPPAPTALQPQQAVVEATGNAVASLHSSAETSNAAGNPTQTPERQSDPLSEEGGLEACEPQPSLFKGWSLMVRILARTSKDPSGFLGRLFAGLRTRRGKDVAQEPYIPPGFPKPSMESLPVCDKIRMLTPGQSKTTRTAFHDCPHLLHQRYVYTRGHCALAYLAQTPPLPRVCCKAASVPR